MRRAITLIVALVSAGWVLFAGDAAVAAPAFTNHVLIAHAPLPDGVTTSPYQDSTGNSEPALAFGADGRLAVDGLAWLPYQVNLWTGSGPGSLTYFGGLDTNLSGRGRGRVWLGDGDADVTITSVGTMIVADLDIIVNKIGNYQLGVSVTRCPQDATGPEDCRTTLLDQAGADREWITSVGTTVYVSWLDSASSTQIRTMRSTDDGRTWHASGSPTMGQDGITATCTYNAEAGPIVADPTTGYVYSVFVCGDTTTKGVAFTGNNIIVSRSTDDGRHWRAFRVYHGPQDTPLANIFPSLAVDAANGDLYATWSDLHTVWLSSSTDHARTWSAPDDISTVHTAVMPWVAALDGKVDVVYYGTWAAGIDDEQAVWNVYDSQSVGGGAWAVLKVSNTPNRVGAVCLEGAGCEGNRELLDLFEVAENPVTGKATVIYTDTTISTWTRDSETHELPEIVLATEQ